MLKGGRRLCVACVFGRWWRRPAESCQRAGALLRSLNFEQNRSARTAGCLSSGH